MFTHEVVVKNERGSVVVAQTKSGELADKLVQSLRSSYESEVFSREIPQRGPVGSPEELQAADREDADYFRRPLPTERAKEYRELGQTISSITTLQGLIHDPRTSRRDIFALSLRMEPLNTTFVFEGAKTLEVVGRCRDHGSEFFSIEGDMFLRWLYEGGFVPQERGLLETFGMEVLRKLL